MANDEAEFGTELRGYRRDDVDRALNDLRRELIKSNTDRADAAKEIRLLQSRVSELQGELDEAGTPTYSGLGTRLESTLRVAEEQSTRLISQADIDAQRLRASSRAEADRTVREAQEEARDTSRTPAPAPPTNSPVRVPRPPTPSSVPAPRPACSPRTPATRPLPSAAPP